LPLDFIVFYQLVYEIFNLKIAAKKYPIAVSPNKRSEKEQYLSLGERKKRIACIHENAQEKPLNPSITNLNIPKLCASRK
jgi:broad specificity polyphosphatase/5'/3'-nucleotidase SurE